MKRIVALRIVALPLPIRPIAALLLAACLLPLASRAAEINLATLSCDKYENEIVGATTHAECLSSLLAARHWFEALGR